MPNNLPLNWCVKSFKDSFVSISPAYKVKQKEYNEFGSYPIIDQGEEFIGGYTDSNKGLISDIPIIAFGDHTRRFKYIDFAFIAGADGLKIYKPIYTDVKFSYYQCLSLDFPNKGYARHNALLQKCDFKIPPLAEQERIVEKIEVLFAGIDEGVERLKSAQAQIKQYRQSVLKSAFEQCKHKGTINDIAQLTKIGPFGSLLHKSDYVKNGIPLVNPSHIKNLTILPNKDICVLPLKLKQLQSYVLKRYDIVIGRRGEMGRCAVVDEQQEGWLCGTGSMFLRLKKENYPYFYALYIASQQCIQYLERNAMGTTMKNLNEKIIKKVPIPLPTLHEQQRIVEEIEKRFAVADVLEKAVNDGLEKVDKLKQSILKKAFEGKLVPQNPNDEPASILLERIKKSQTPTKGKKK